MSEEARRTAELTKEMRGYGWLVQVNFSGGQQRGRAYGSSGWPDRTVCTPKWHGWLEFKSFRGTLRKDQELLLWKLELMHPGCGYLVRFLPDEWLSIENSRGERLACCADNAISLIDALATLQDVLETP